MYFSSQGNKTFQIFSYHIVEELLELILEAEYNLKCKNNV